MKVAAAFVALFAAFVLQGQFADRVASTQWRPDLILTVVIISALLLRSPSLGVIAFIGGFLEGVLCGRYYAAFTISRVLAALVAVTVAEPLEVNPAVAVGVAALSAAAAQVVFLLVEPSGNLAFWANTAARQVLLVSAMAAVLYPFARRLAGDPRPEEL